jgi:hypothetical protein
MRAGRVTRSGGGSRNAPGGARFGTVKIDGATEVLSVALLDISGKTLFKTDLAPEA